MTLDAYKSLLFAGILALVPCLASAQTAQQSVTGDLSTSGCKTGETVCFIQYGPTGSSGGTTSNIVGINGVAPSVGAGASDTGTLRVINSSDSLIGVKGTNGSTIAAPANPLPGTPYDSHGTQLDFTSAALAILTSQYPNGSTPITGNATGSTGAVVGTLSGTSGKTTYICGFDVSAIGGTAAVGPITVAGLTGSSSVYQLASTAGGVTMARSFNPCIPASASNTPITITTTADGTATAVDVNSFGYQL